MNCFKKNQGVSLVLLILILILLIIIASISIGAVAGTEGIFNRSKEIINDYNANVDSNESVNENILNEIENVKSSINK